MQEMVFEYNEPFSKYARKDMRSNWTVALCGLLGALYNAKCGNVNLLHAWMPVWSSSVSNRQTCDENCTFDAYIVAKRLFLYLFLSLQKAPNKEDSI